MRHSKYWDDFEKRAQETIACINSGITIPVRRVAVFITEKCNMSCAYCNHDKGKREMSEECFDSVVNKYGKDAIIHITGGEPSLVKWLYPYLIEHGNEYRFHLNTNALLLPPSSSVKRLKVSLDSHISTYWNRLTGINAFDTVVNNIKKCSKETVLTITFTMTKENYLTIPDFIEFSNREFKDVYAIFFSVYKGNNPRFIFSEEDVDSFFETIKPAMNATLNEESKNLLNETIQEKFRIIEGKRFPENQSGLCYLSLSERVISPDGTESACSHLYRDGVKNKPGEICEKCLYGCNRRLVDFNEYVKRELI
ncbi:MAG: radical SAM protein [Candidatus Omnitrophica bacterium]|nr:radical SAM protein [Candidatus Omnitrophota bacterium]MDD5353366.1 radical SAM protein [Candidatus Omnitrophota bacterium]MDD5551355.1 radical SAM protein [Candidatus Omnitrophota bacterium]